MDKFSFIALWDIYRGLLTATQREITDLYFNLDLTVSEIAAEKGISRQAVSECMQNCKKQLEDYENRLGLLKRINGLGAEHSLKLAKAKKWAEKFALLHPEFAIEADKLLEILDKDYFSEASVGAATDGEIKNLDNKRD